MGDKNKVVWTEGMFLRPQHFQQYDRYLSHCIESRSNRLIPYAWGLTQLEIDGELLSLGRFSLKSCCGIFPDGTGFDMPGSDELPDALEIPEDCKDQLLYLTLPLKKSTGSEIQHDEPPEPMARYQLEIQEIKDFHSNLNAETAVIETGKLWARLQLETDEMGAYATLPVARIIEKRSDNQLILDTDYIPACLNCDASKKLGEIIHEIEGLLTLRGDQLAERMGSPGSSGVAEVVDFLLLEIVNRYEPLFKHLAELSALHPLQLYQIMLQMAGELATITETNRRPGKLPDYVHDQQSPVFKSLTSTLRTALNWVPEFRAVPIPLKSHQHGIRSGEIGNRELIHDAEFVLAINAEVATEKLQHNFPNQTTIASVEKLRDLVMSHTSGIRISPMAVAPRQIPYHAGFTYFRLDKHDDIWKDIEESGAIAMHFSGEYPGLEVEFWAIKG